MNFWLLELVAHINTSERPSRQERSERRNSDIHILGVSKIRLYN
jgi:hypothetical protein